MILEVSVHSNNINMLELFVNLNLSAQCFSHLLCFNHTLVEFFNGHFDTARFMHRQMVPAVNCKENAPVR